MTKPKDTFNNLPAKTDDTYAVLNYDPADIKSMVDTAVGGGQLTAFDLDRVHVPAGGGLSWEIPSLEGPTEAKEISGVIIATKTPRIYWAKSFDDTGGGVPPDCSADDGIFGVGDPGGDCALCPLARFGSDDRGRGQACKQTYMLFLMRKDSILPIVLTVPPSSFATIKKYLLRLAGNMKFVHQVETGFVLQKEKNKDGIAYAAIVPSMLRVLNDGDAKKMAILAESLAPYFSRVRGTMDNQPQDS